MAPVVSVPKIATPDIGYKLPQVSNRISNLKPLGQMKLPKVGSSLRRKSSGRPFAVTRAKNIPSKVNLVPVLRQGGATINLHAAPIQQRPVKINLLAPKTSIIPHVKIQLPKPKGLSAPKVSRQPIPKAPNVLPAKKPAFNTKSKINNLQSKLLRIDDKQLKFAYKALAPISLPKSAPRAPVSPRDDDNLPLIPVRSSTTGAAGQTNTARNSSNSNNTASRHSGSRHNNLPLPVMLGLFGHLPLSFKQKVSRFISAISKRKKNGIGFLFSARSPNIIGMNGCNLAFVHQIGQEERDLSVNSHKNPGLNGDYGLFCFIKQLKCHG
ncbi:hypothetical protein ACFL1K_04225 [Candidatus Omnitrophota bacterium]